MMLLDCAICYIVLAARNVLPCSLGLRLSPPPCTIILRESPSEKQRESLVSCEVMETNAECICCLETDVVDDKIQVI